MPWFALPQTKDSDTIWQGLVTMLQISPVQIKDTHLINNKLPLAEILCGEWSNPAWPKTPNENTDNLVLQLSSQLNVNLKSREISRTGSGNHSLARSARFGLNSLAAPVKDYLKRASSWRVIRPSWKYTHRDLTPITNEIAYKARQL